MIFIFIGGGGEGGVVQMCCLDRLPVSQSCITLTLSFSWLLCSKIESLASSLARVRNV